MRAGAEPSQPDAQHAELQYAAAFGTNPAALTPDLVVVPALVLALTAAVGANLGFIGLAFDAAQMATRDQQIAMDTLRENQQALDSRDADRAWPRIPICSDQILERSILAPLLCSAAALNPATCSRGGSQAVEGAPETVLRRCLRRIVAAGTPR